MGQNKNNVYKQKFKDSLAISRFKQKIRQNKWAISKNQATVALKFLRSDNESRKVRMSQELAIANKKKMVNHTKYVLDADIKECLDNICHD